MGLNEDGSSELQSKHGLQEVLPFEPVPESRDERAVRHGIARRDLPEIETEFEQRGCGSPRRRRWVTLTTMAAATRRNAAFERSRWLNDLNVGNEKAPIEGLEDVQRGVDTE